MLQHVGSGSTPVAFSPAIKDWSAEVSSSSMVHCSVVFCPAADMSYSSLHPSSLLCYALFSPWCSGLVSVGNTAAPEFLSSCFPLSASSHTSWLYFTISSNSPSIPLCSLLSFNLSFHLHLLICPPLICPLSHPQPYFTSFTVSSPPTILLHPFFS